VISGYADVNDFARHAESKGFRSCKLSPYVCRLHNGHYAFDEVSYDIGKFKLNGSSLHGLLYDVPFDVISHESNDHLAMVVLQHSYEGSDKGFPFPFDMVVTYTLSHQNKLTLHTQVTNRHNAHIPMADGWHPYFSLNAPVNDLHLQTASNTMLEFDSALIPTGKLLEDTRFTNGALLGDVQLDNCFLLNRASEQPACTLSNQATGLQLKIYAVENYPYLQLYIPPQRNCIAIENLSAAPDAFNNKMGLIVLEPGESIGFSAAYEMSAA
jgi:aldose 1-epimerase